MPESYKIQLDNHGSVTAHLFFCCIRSFLTGRKVPLLLLIYSWRWWYDGENICSTELKQRIKNGTTELKQFS